MVDYIIATASTSPLDAKTILQKLQAIIDIKGGGKINLVEGRANCEWETFNASVEQVIKGATSGK
jgi:alanyl-tRNA synthetase